MKFSRNVQNGAKHTQGGSIRIQPPAMSLCPGYNTLRRGFYENDTTDSEECDQNDGD